MRTRWRVVQPLDTSREYVVLASSIPPLSGSSTGALFRGSRAVRAQLASTDGVMGFSLLAEPIRKRYATLSVWRDDAALESFARSGDHARLMRELAPAMGPTRFERWAISGADGWPEWRGALERLW